jgi:MATE family multidrug resistance protein
MPYWYRRVFLLAIPLILSNLTQPLLSTVDTILSGHLPGPAALGGVAVGGIFFNAIFWTFGFLRMATTGLIAQSHGASDEDQLLHHFGRAFLTALLIGGLVLLLQGPLISVSLGLLGASQEVRQNAQIYCGIRIWSAPASLANYTILGYLLGRQRARTALLLQTAINVVNVAVALVLVLRLQWGVSGIATATLTAEWTGCLLGLGIMLASGVRPRSLRWSEILHGPSLRHLFALNRDILLRTLSLVAAYACFTRAGAKSGDAVLAANAVLLNFHLIAAYGLDGIANATEALVGEAIGGCRRADYRAILKASASSAFLVALLISLAYLVFGKQIIAIYTDQAPIRLLAAAVPSLGGGDAHRRRLELSAGRRFCGRHTRARTAKQHVDLLRRISRSGNCAGSAIWQSRPLVRDARFHGAAGYHTWAVFTANREKSLPPE